jgi:predicted transcriptional regulator
MNEKAVRIRLIELGLQLKDLSRLTKIDYDRLQKVIHGYRPVRPDELRAIATALGLEESESPAGVHRNERRSAGREI